MALPSMVEAENFSEHPCIKVKYEELLNHVLPVVVTDLQINISLLYDTFFSVVAYCYVLTQGSVYFFSSINIIMSLTLSFLHRTLSDSMIFEFCSNVGRRPTRFLLRLFALCRSVSDAFLHVVRTLANR
jgi:hypothetical protein